MSPHPNQKYFGVRKSTIEYVQELSSELMAREVTLSLPFDILEYGGGFHVADIPSECAIGIHTERLVRALKELELAFWTVAGRQYQYRDANYGPGDNDDAEEKLWRAQRFWKKARTIWKGFNHY